MSADSVTQQIAVEAARLVVEGGMEYGQAKAKAAKALGQRRAVLPSNEAVEAEVREYLALFCSESQPEELHALREVAMHWMSRLHEFRPHLSGAVWRGTATRLSAVHIDLYCDDPKSASIALLNLGVDHALDSIEGRKAGEPLSVLTLASPSPALGESVTVHLFVRDKDDLRGALRPDARGRNWRGDLQALQQRIKEEGSP